MIRASSVSDMSDGADDTQAPGSRTCASPTLSVSSQRDGRATCPDACNKARDIADRRRGERLTSPERATFGATAATFRAAPPERDNGAQRGALLSVVPPPTASYAAGDRSLLREVRFSPSIRPHVEETYPSINRSYETVTPSGEILFRKPFPSSNQVASDASSF